MHEPQAAQAQLPSARAAHVGQLDLAGVAHDDVLDLAAAVEQHADLAADLPRRLAQVTGQLRRAQLARLHAAAVGREESTGLARLEARRVAVQIVARTCSRGAAAAPWVLACARFARQAKAALA